jgi:5-methyltetrahydrofolate--homocysteine methyltransferase
MEVPERLALFRSACERRILVLDGAMGTMIQSRNLSAEDFGGAQYDGCNEHLNLTRPDVIRTIHDTYLEAGADLVSTNSFGCAPYVLGEYGLAERCYEISLAASRLASESALRHSTSERPRFAIGAMGPGTRTITVTGNVTFDEVREGYYLQARGLIEGGVDALLLETVQDTLNVKAAAIGVKRAMADLADVKQPRMPPDGHGTAFGVAGPAEGSIPAPGRLRAGGIGSFLRRCGHHLFAGRACRRWSF